MTHTTRRVYTRPARDDKARQMAHEDRFKWIDRLHLAARRLLPTIELLCAEEHHIATSRDRTGSNRNPWINCQLRARHIAVIEVLQKLHLKNTGKEISRAEVVAALMANGLEAVTAAEEFKTSRASRQDADV